MTGDTGELERTDESRAKGGPSAGRIPQLDGIRALAVLLVLVHHGLVPFEFGGYVGVDVFFVMSGFLITGILLREVDRYGRIRLRRFYVRRLVRLYPALLLVVAVLFVPALLLTQNQLGFLMNTGAALTYTMPVLEQAGHAFGPWRHTWSLGVEEMFYLAWPVLLLGGVRWVRSRALLAGLLLLVGGVTVTAGVVVGPLTVFRGAGLFFGCALAVYLHDRAGARVPAALGWVGLVGVLLSAVLGSGEGRMGWAIAVCCVSSTLLIAHFATDSRGWLSRVFAVRPAAYFGLISYEVYLWHYPLIVLGAAVFSTQPVMVSAVAIPAAVGLAAVTHRVLAGPLDRLKRRLPY